jgi:hypothetical protein
MMMGYWTEYTIEEFKELIEEKPLTEEDVIFVLRNKIKKILFSESFTLSRITPHDGDTYTILISLREEDPKVGLIHEVCHAHYRIGGISPVTPCFGPENEKCIKIEEIIENEARRFYEGNKKFVKQIYSSLFSESANRT